MLTQEPAEPQRQRRQARFEKDHQPDDLATIRPAVVGHGASLFLILIIEGDIPRTQGRSARDRDRRTGGL
jgi:hypothetical protein